MGEVGEVFNLGMSAVSIKEWYAREESNLQPTDP